MQSIEVQKLAEVLESGKVELIDVRTPVEFRETHANNAKNLPLDSPQLKQRIAAGNANTAAPIYLICKSGSRSAMAYRQFADAGVMNVVSVEGGTDAWLIAGLPVVRGKKAMSLERQVRILAGFLTLLGAMLGYFIHPYFIGLSAFIGAGLMFAGITDTCGMGMMLAKMPWNQCSEVQLCSVQKA